MSLFSTDLRHSGDKMSAASDPTSINRFGYRVVGKRALDIFVVLATALITVPVIIVLAIAVLLDGHGPFYTQDRVGLDGKTFKIWKLRTMVPNAKALLGAHLAANPAAREEWARKQKLDDDPRITTVGRVLRKTSLDELPQLFNVLNGTMSLIGPRPMMPEQTDQYSGTAYYRLRPGMSGLWQVSDRNDGDFAGRVRFDELYDTRVSLGTDVQVIFQTVGVVMRGTGR